MSDKLLDTNEEPFDISLDYALLDLQYMRGRLDADTFIDDEVKRHYWKAYKSLYKHIETLENQYNKNYEVIADAQVKLADAYTDVDTIIDMLSKVDKITEMGYTVPENLKELLF